MGAHRRDSRSRPRRGRPLIVLLHGAPAYGAVERYVEAIACGMREDCVLVHPGVERFELLGVETIVVRRPTTLRLARLLRELGPRVAHVTDVWPQAVFAARLARVPRVLVTHHTPELPRRDNSRGRAWQRLGWALRPEVIYTSNADRARDGRSPSHVVPLGVDLDRFASGTPTLQKDGVLVGDVARLARQKDHRTLLAAMATVRREHPDARLVLVGDGELRAELEQLAAGLGLEGSVLFTGARDDVPDLLASFDVFAHAARYEGFCLAVVEAQAAGIPVVATAVGGVPEAVANGETGLLVPPGDDHALAAAITRLLEDQPLADRLAAAGRRRVHDLYSERRMVEETLRLYGEAPTSSTRIESSERDTSHAG